jgi:peptidyl-prolyl cis-trans isomerase C
MFALQSYRRLARGFVFVAFLVLAGGHGWAAQALFADPVVATGTGIEVRQSQVDQGFTAYKAARAAMGQPMPPQAEPQIRQQVLDKLIATQIFVSRATPGDREAARKFASEIIADGKKKAASDRSYERQLLALGTTPEKYEAEILEQAVVKSVLDRELKSKQIISEAQLAEYYEKNPQLFEEPETVRVAQILLATRRIPTGEPLPARQMQEKKALAAQILQRIRGGEDFGKLVAQFSEDPESKSKGGELTFARRGPVPPEFEAAAFTLKPNQISDVVQSVFGFHIIKLIEKTPSSKVPLAKVEAKVRESLQQQKVQEQLPAYLEDLRKQLSVKILVP